MAQGDQGTRDRTRWRIARRAAAAGVALLVVLAAGELVLRVTDRAPDPPGPRSRPGLPTISGPYAASRRNVEGNFHGAWFRSDRFGFRGPNRARSRSPEVLRILVTGESVTLGGGLLEESTYAGRLETRLREGRPPVVAEVVNAAYGGANAGMALDRLRDAMNAYGGDVLVYGHSLDDIRGEGFAEPPEDERRADRRWRALRQSRVHLVRLLPSLRRAVLDRWDREARDRGNPFFWNYLRNPTAWRHFEGELHRFAHYAGQREGCGVLFVLGSMQELGPFHRFGPIYDKLAAAARERGLTPVIALDESLWGHRSRALMRSAYDPHPNRAGHDLLAEALARGVRSLPGRCLAPGRPTAWPPVSEPSS